MTGVNTKNIAFSVIMPVYNRAFCVCEAIDSLLAQTYQNFELVIVDDGSTDKTAEVVKEKYKKELKQGKIVYRVMKHGGVCKARNLGLKISRNPWIAYLDSDNTLVTTFLEVFAEAIAHRRAQTYYAQIKQNISGKVHGKPFDLEKLRCGNYIDMGGFVHARKLVDELGGFDENMTRVVDWELILRYTQKYRPVFIEQIVVNYNDSKDYERVTTSEDALSNTLYLYRKHLPEPVGKKAPLLGFIRYSVPSGFANGRDIFEEKYLAYRYRIFKEITLKSLAAQKDKNFNVVVLHSADLPQKYKDHFAVLEYKYPFLHNMYLEKGESLGQLLRRAEQMYLDFDRKMVATFRVDNDDALPKAFTRVLRHNLKPRFAGYAVSLPNITLVQRSDEARYLTYEWFYASNSIGLAYLSTTADFQNIMDLGHHGKVGVRLPLLCLPEGGGLQTINGENVANHFPKPELVEEVSETELTERLSVRFPNFNLRCLDIFPVAKITKL